PGPPLIWIGAVIGLLTIAGAGAPAQPPTPNRQIDEEVLGEATKSRDAPPRMVLWHTHDDWRWCVFRLNGETGVFRDLSDGPGWRRRDLEFERNSRVDGMDGFVYKVQGENTWYFFTKDPVRQQGNHRYYGLYSADKPADAKGLQRWLRVATASWTRGAPL